MNKQPIMYLQTDTHWKNEPYRVSGETSTIGTAGCGPTCAAMIIATLMDKAVTPKTCCDWSVAHGYKALNQGTYYAYFVPQFKAYGIDCRQLAKGACDEALGLLKQGYYIIALMGPGTWTSSGHFVLLWWEDGKVHINDPASTAVTRTTGSLTDFKAQAKYFWAVDAREHNAKEVQKMLDLSLPQIRKGSKGGLVKAAQLLLKGYGYHLGWYGADGDFGDATEKAVIAFQKAENLLADGIVGEVTWKKLMGL